MKTKIIILGSEPFGLILAKKLYPQHDVRWIPLDSSAPFLLPRFVTKYFGLSTSAHLPTQFFFSDRSFPLTLPAVQNNFGLDLDLNSVTDDPLNLVQGSRKKLRALARTCLVQNRLLYHLCQFIPSLLNLSRLPELELNWVQFISLLDRRVWQDYQDIPCFQGSSEASISAIKLNRKTWEFELSDGSKLEGESVILNFPFHTSLSWLPRFFKLSSQKKTVAQKVTLNFSDANDFAATDPILFPDLIFVPKDVLSTFRVHRQPDGFTMTVQPHLKEKSAFALLFQALTTSLPIGSHLKTHLENRLATSTVTPLEAPSYSHLNFYTKFKNVFYLGSHLRADLPYSIGPALAIETLIRKHFK